MAALYAQTVFGKERCMAWLVGCRWCKERDSRKAAAVYTRWLKTRLLLHDDFFLGCKCVRFALWALKLHPLKPRASLCPSRGPVQDPGISYTRALWRIFLSSFSSCVRECVRAYSVCGATVYTLLLLPRLDAERLEGAYAGTYLL